MDLHFLRGSFHNLFLWPSKVLGKGWDLQPEYPGLKPDPVTFYPRDQGQIKYLSSLGLFTHL